MIKLKFTDEFQNEGIEALFAGFNVVVDEESVNHQWRFYDTFDWRLFSRSLLLRRSDEELTLASLTDGQKSSCDIGISRPTFAWDLPDGPLRQALTPILKARALLRLGSVHTTKTTYRILNDEMKTVAYLTLVEIRTAPTRVTSSRVAYMSVQPLRGYGKRVRRLIKTLQARTSALTEVESSLDEAIFCHALTAAGHTPGSYNAKLDFHLDAKMRADEATKVILRRLLETIRANEAGIRADIDSECLHDQRVAIRRTRSALSQISHVFPAATTDGFRRDFRALGKRTNELRDLDVYLLAEPKFRAMLPPPLDAELTPLFDLLRARRVEVLAQVIDELNRPRYETVLSDWEAFLNSPDADDPTAPNAGVPIIDLARSRIHKRYRRIVKDGTRILDNTEDELLHALRLECKNLRYLLEFFTSLFPRKQIAGMVKQLKQLQDNLGDFADLTVQQESLLGLAEQLPVDDSQSRRTLMAIGALVVVMGQKQQAVKADFADTFTHFAAPENQAEYRALFRVKKKRKQKRKAKANRR